MTMNTYEGFPIFEGGVIPKGDNRAMTRAFENADTPTVVREIFLNGPSFDLEANTVSMYPLEIVRQHLETFDAELERLKAISEGVVAIVEHTWGFTETQTPGRSGRIYEVDGLQLVAEVTVPRPAHSLRLAQHAALEKTTSNYKLDTVVGDPIMYDLAPRQFKVVDEQIFLHDIDPMIKYQSYIKIY